MKINLTEIKFLFSYAEKVYVKKISFNKAIAELVKIGINKNSAADYVFNYGHLIEGRVFTRTMSVLSTQYYLARILENHGIETLKKALFSLSLHIGYYEGITNRNVVKRKALLNEYLEKYNLKVDDYFGEEITKDDKFVEGSTKMIKVNIYERNPIARKKCIEHYGARCEVCEFDFGIKYGELGAGFIHVHHLLELSRIGKEYKVDPKKDMVPVCPNCHAMLHKKKPAYSIKTLKSLLR